MVNWILFILMGFAVPVQAQDSGASQVRAWLDQEQAVPGEEVRLFIEVAGPGAADCSLSRIPDSAKMRIKDVSGPHFAMQPASGASEGTNELVASFEVILIPLDVGVLSLPPARIIMAGGRQFMGPRLSLEVRQDPRQDKGTVLSVHTSKPSVFLYERIVFQMSLEIRADRFQQVERAETERLSLPWLETEPSFVSLRLGRPHDMAGLRSIPVLNSRSAIDFSFGRDRAGEDEICIFRAEASYLPTEAGLFSFGPCTYEARLSERDELFCTSSALQVEVVPLPDLDRPESASNGVGRFRVSFDASPLTLRPGDPMELRFSIEGEGNLELLELPGFPALSRDFHVYGFDDHGDASHRWRVFHLAPLGPLTREIPALSFSWFEPDRKSYETAAWGPCEIDLLPGKERGAGGPITSRARQEDEIETIMREWDPRPGTRVFAILSSACLALSMIACLLGAQRAHRRAQKMKRAEKSRSIEALAAFRRTLERRVPASPETLANAFGDYLVERFHLSRSDALAGALPDLLAARGLSADLAQKVDYLMRAFDAQRFAVHPGTADQIVQEQALALVDALEREAKP
ncbi:MAG: hypothetical protein ABIK28_15565 [Planctomycetota bacterium]